MQCDGAGMARQAGQAALRQNGPTDQGHCNLLGLERADAYGGQVLNTVVARPASGSRDLWAEVKCHWLDAGLSA